MTGTLGPERDDQLAALQALVTHGAAGGKKKFKDFLPKWGKGVRGNPEDVIKTWRGHG
jgi:hypothetical protein